MASLYSGLLLGLSILVNGRLQSDASASHRPVDEWTLLECPVGNSNVQLVP